MAKKEKRASDSRNPSDVNSTEELKTISPESEYQPWEKRPLSVPQNIQRTRAKYASFEQFQNENPTRMEMAAALNSMRCFEIDELIDMCPNQQKRIYCEGHKPKELIFRYSMCSSDNPYHASYPGISIYDGHGEGLCIKYQTAEGEKKKKVLTVGCIRKVKNILEDDILFETETMEAPYQKLILDGTEYTFYLSVKGRENTLTGSNIHCCRKDYEHCIHAAHMIDTLEQIRDILVPCGVPAGCFSMADNIKEEKTEVKKAMGKDLRKTVETMCRSSIRKYGVAIIWSAIDPDYEQFFRERFGLATDDDYITFVKLYLKAVENNYIGKDYFEMRQTAEKCIEEVIDQYQFTEEKKRETVQMFIVFFLRNLIQDQVEIAQRENYQGEIPEIGDDDINVLDLADCFACAHVDPDYIKQAEFLDTIGITYEYDQPHMVCWFSAQITLGSGNYSRTVPNYSSKLTYNRLNNPYSLLWIATVLGEDFDTIRKVSDEMNQKKNLAAMSGIVRKNIPFSRILELYDAMCSEGEEENNDE